MTVVVRCPNPDCRAKSTVVESLGGNTVTCKKCGKRFIANPRQSAESSVEKRRPPTSGATQFSSLPADFGRYHVLKLLGQGGMGAVYLAEDSQLGRSVALKIPSFDASKSPRRVERFVREARSAAILHHPNICTVFDVGEIGSQPFITMAYIAGTPLDEMIDPEITLSQQRAAELTYKIAGALEHAHQKGIIHRDLKPANIMLSTDGEPVVMDFGLAKRATSVESNEAKLTRDGGIVGTPSYTSPEQVKGDDKSVGPTSDVYSLGVILFELLTGCPPYSGNVGVVLGQILAAAVPSVREFRSDVDPRLDAICQQAMAKEPAARFQSMGEFAAALMPFTGSEVSSHQRLAKPPSSASVPDQASGSLFDEFAKFADGPTEKSLKKTKRPPRTWFDELRRHATFIAVAVVAASLLALFAVIGPTSAPTHSAAPVSDTKRIQTVNESVPSQQNNVASLPHPEAVESNVQTTPAPSSLGTKFVLVPKGKSWLGGVEGQPGGTEVEIREDFYLGATEVTQGEWEQVMGKNPSYFSHHGAGKTDVKDLSDEYLQQCPVEMVSWKECQEFIRRLNEKERATGWVYRLPLEKEWEYACRGGPLANRSDSAFDFYFEPPSNVLLPEQASFGQRERRTSKVGSHPAGRLELSNMHDNVHEWCADELPRQNSNQGETPRVIRGGSWWSPPGFCRTVTRFIEASTSQRYNIGLRLARVRSD